MIKKDPSYPLMQESPVLRPSVALIAADPFTTTPERLEEEAEVISSALNTDSGLATVAIIHAINRDELVRQLLETRPQILQFTGHGSVSRRVLLQAASGDVRNATGGTLARSVESAGLVPECIFFNNCEVSGGRNELAYVAGRVLSVSQRGDAALDTSRIFYSTWARTGNAVSSFDAAVQGLEAAQQLKTSGTWILEAPEELQTDEGLDEVFESPDKLVPSRSRFIIPAQPASASAGRGSGPSPARSAPKAVALQDGTLLYRVWFGTNRKPISSSSHFGTEFDSQVHYGQCRVLIPKHHRIGDVESEKWWERFTFWKKRDHMRILDLKPLEGRNFVDLLGESLAALDHADRALLCYVHGFNVSFPEAALRAAQLGSDLKVPGETVFFSWPSVARLHKYLVDTQNVQASEPYLTSFLLDLVQHVGASQIHVIAHSMGNQLLLRSLQAVFDVVKRKTGIQLGQIFLAAPDVDARVFTNLARVYVDLSRRTTLYVSEGDFPLSLSGGVQGHPRAGYKPPLTIVDGIDTIEVPRFDFDRLGHGYYAAARPILSDMYTLMRDNSHPSKRMGIYPLVDSKSRASYWRMRH